MKTDTKLAPSRGAFQRLPFPSRIVTALRAIEGAFDRHAGRPLRDMDRWSDQAEVAFYEERGSLRA